MQAYNSSDMHMHVSLSRACVDQLANESCNASWTCHNHSRPTFAANGSKQSAILLRIGAMFELVLKRIGLN